MKKKQLLLVPYFPFLPLMCCLVRNSSTLKQKKQNRKMIISVLVEDPYRWLEDDHSLETKAWVMKQNLFTEKYLVQIPFRDSLKSRMKQLWSFISYKAPFRCGTGYFYYRHDGVQNQPVLFFMKGVDFVPYSYFDPNLISKQGTTALTQTVPSSDGVYLAFQVSEAGSDWNDIRIKEVKTMKSLPEVLKGVKFSNIAWFKEGFFYSRYASTETSSMQKMSIIKFTITR
ncbi:MAG: hypothetical protein IPP46_12995 [Bacteroidetes bacterium]|nr:hypothetical protein [Bacteroidota bacterium]